MIDFKQKIKYHLTPLVPFIAFKNLDEAFWKYKSDKTTEASKFAQIAKPFFNMIYSLGVAVTLMYYAGESRGHGSLNAFEWNNIAKEKKQERLIFQQNIADKLFDQIDTNNDKIITLDEFSKGINKSYQKNKNNRFYDLYNTLNEEFFLGEKYVDKTWSK